MIEMIRFADERSQVRDVVGGKGANLGRMVAAGLPVPPGFVVPTDVYREFVTAAGLDATVAETADGLDYGDAEKLEQATAGLREKFVAAAVPSAVEQAILAAYAELGEDAYVAVRSSGTAEDTAEASFAGLHDTYLDIRGDAQVLDAVKRCWASLWTARATAYRDRMGFPHGEASLAVVVQAMIESDVAGVMFTANPLNGATDETVINASWGLGEAVVSGIVTPDEFVLSNAKLSTRRQNLGSKEREIVRDPDNASGTVEREVTRERQQEPTLDGEQLRRLGALGQRITRYYGRKPQDIEWALAGGELYVLQSRDVTGTTLAWDEDVDAWQALPDDDEYVWTRAFADEWWTGAVTPLFYSIRADGQTECHINAMRNMGLHDSAEMRIFKYYNAEVYWNASVEKVEAPKFIPGFLRSPGALGRMPPAWWQEAMDAPFSWASYAKLYAKLMVTEPAMGPTKWISTVYDFYENRTAEADGISDEEIRELDDEALMKYLDERMAFWVEFNHHQWAGFFIFAPGLLLLLGDLLGRWYTGGNDQAFSDLMTGLPKQTVTLTENEILWDLGRMIRSNEKLGKLFEDSDGPTFFAAIKDEPEAAEFRAKYDQMLVDHGHRGQADRDFWFPRRIENPQIDYNAFRAILSSTSDVSPAEQEEKTKAMREASTEEIIANLRKQPLGFLKAELFKVILDQTYRFLQLRDDERHYVDRISWSKKRALLEINRRLLDRGLVEEAKEFYFLSKGELYERLRESDDLTLTRAKIEGRRANFDAFDRKEMMPPAFLQGGETIDLDLAAEEGEEEVGVLKGLGTSRGTVTGRARIIRGLEEIGRVEEHDILVCQATDPGWTPVFLVIDGLVLETGGMLAHGSCLSREYGLPAVQVRNAMGLIEDGATITVDGETGNVTLVDVVAAAKAEAENAPAAAE